MSWKIPTYDQVNTVDAFTSLVCVCGKPSRADMMIYVGNLPDTLREKIVEDTDYLCDGCFDKYFNKLKLIDIVEACRAWGAPDDTLEKIEQKNTESENE